MSKPCAPEELAPFYPTEKALVLPPKMDALSAMAVSCDDGGKPCSIPVQVGLFSTERITT